jgi:predicted SnoaL-like aldol condensation-catalyzing enzyme
MSDGYQLTEEVFKISCAFNDLARRHIRISESNLAQRQSRKSGQTRHVGNGSRAYPMLQLDAPRNVLGMEQDLNVGGAQVLHYDLFTAVTPPNESGHTQTDGPTQAKQDQDKEKNKALIREYYEIVHISGDHTKVPQYCGEHCIRHESGVRDGMAAFMCDLAAATKHGKQSRSIDKIKFVLGQGDFVFVADLGSVEGKACAYCDLYRAEGKKIAEHWGLIQEVPPQEKRKTITACSKSDTGAAPQDASR